jgi:hypothetical protein
MVSLILTFSNFYALVLPLFLVFLFPRAPRKGKLFILICFLIVCILSPKIFQRLWSFVQDLESVVKFTPLGIRVAQIVSSLRVFFDYPLGRGVRTAYFYVADYFSVFLGRSFLPEEWMGAGGIIRSFSDLGIVGGLIFSTISIYSLIMSYRLDRVFQGTNLNYLGQLSFFIMLLYFLYVNFQGDYLLPAYVVVIFINAKIYEEVRRWLALEEA